MHGASPKPLCHNEHRRSRHDATQLSPRGCLRLLSVRAMLRDGTDPAVAAVVTGVPRALVEQILTLDHDRRSRARAAEPVRPAHTRPH